MDQQISSEQHVLKAEFFDRELHRMVSESPVVEIMESE
jgi:hypothetical protein